MGQAKRRIVFEQQCVSDYLASVERIACPSCAASGIEIVDLLSTVPLFREPAMPPGRRFICGRCLTEFDEGRGPTRSVP